MFRWLRRLFGQKDAAGYTLAEREIFPYWDGKGKRLGDPLAIHRKLLTDPDIDMRLDPAIAQTPSIDGLKATGRIASGVRKAFGIPDLESGGLTDGECLALFIQFGAYIGELSEGARPLVSSPGPTASAQESSAMPTGAASG